MVPDWECSSTSIFFRAAPRSRLISSENAAPALGLVLLLARVVLAGPRLGVRPCGRYRTCRRPVGGRRACSRTVRNATTSSSFHMNWPGKSPLMIAFYP